jgi:hypothetical protein
VNNIVHFVRFASEIVRVISVNSYNLNPKQFIMGKCSRIVRTKIAILLLFLVLYSSLIKYVG